jgi:glycerol kinase
MEADIGQPLCVLSADGGASGNAFLMQLQADLIDRPVHTSGVEEIGALGAAAMVFATSGDAVPFPASVSERFMPRLSSDQRHLLRNNWASAVAQAIPQG